jgi:uncharacterized oligopeptide transporter (OPT) family protein
MICPHIVNVSVLLGGILSWGVMWPLIAKKKGSWYPATDGDASLHGLQAYRVNIQSYHWVTFVNAKSYNVILKKNYLDYGLDCLFLYYCRFLYPLL